MQRIKHHYCWVKAFAGADDGLVPRGAIDVELVATSAPPLASGNVPLAWSKSGELVQDYMPPAPQPNIAEVAFGPVDPKIDDDQRAGSGSLGGPDAPPPPLGGANGMKPFFGPVDPYMHFAGASLMGTWKFEAMSDFAVAEGMPAIKLAWRPVYGERADVIAWLVSPQGIEWSKGALSLGLTCFAAIGDL